MTDMEIYNLINEFLKPLWKEWDIDQHQLNAWTRALRPFDCKTVKQATYDHYSSRKGAYKFPKLYAIIEKAKFYQPKKIVAKKERKDYEPDVFVQCIDHENDIKLFQFYPIYVRTDRQDDRDYILAAAENTRQKVESCYGGTWITVQQTNYNEMRDALLKHRAKANQCHPELVEGSV